MKSALLAALLFLGFAACTPPVTDKPVVPIGDFNLGYNVVVGDQMAQGPLSRTADTQEITSSLKTAIDDRLSRYDGDKLYHVVTHVDMYVMARAGVPFVFSPKTALMVSMTVWDDAAQAKLNETPIQVTLLENSNSKNLLGSGLGQTVDEQIQSMAESAAYQIESWLRKQNQEQNWFNPDVDIPLYTPPQATENADAS